jgi:oligopeptide/dipeptide ABC transporter ATP-binding protein
MLFRRLKEQTGISFLVISHSPEVLTTIADAVLVMHAGRIVEQGPSRELFRNPLHPFTKGLVQCMPQLNGSRGARSRKLIPIPGNPTEPAARSSGCPFEPRCSERMETCASHPPPVFELGASRSVRCFRYAS